MQDFDEFLAENGLHPDFKTDPENAFAYHRKLIAWCIVARRLREEYGDVTDEEPSAFPHFSAWAS